MIIVFGALSAAPALAWRDDHRSGDSDRRQDNRREFDRRESRDHDSRDRGNHDRHYRGQNRGHDRGSNVEVYIGQNFGSRHSNYYQPARRFYSDGHHRRHNYTLIGFMFGGYPAYGMSPYDYGYAANVFELTPTRQTVAWQNPDSGVGYQLTPVRTYQVNNGQYCREYQATAIIGGRAQGTFGTACRTDDGSWRIMN